MDESKTKVANLNLNWSSDTEGAVDFVDEYPTTKELSMFAQEVRRIMPKVKFAPCKKLWGRVRATDGREIPRDIPLVKSFYVYMPDHIFVMGQIGYGDFSVNNNGDKPTYMVFSRKICNDKFAPHRDQFNMIMSTSLVKAKRNASTYLSPHSLHELAEGLYGTLRTNISSTVGDAKSKVFALTGKIRHSHDAIMQELRNLKAQGVTFITAEFQELERNAELVMEDYRERVRPNINVVFVRIRNIGEDTYADVFDIGSVTDERKLSPSSPQTTTLLSELDQAIAGKVSVLSILMDGQYVENVGERINATTFWVLR